MKIAAIATALAASAVALPAAAQTWWNPEGLTTAQILNKAYVEVDGGVAFQGRSTVQIAASGLGTSYASAKSRHGPLADGLVGFRLVPGIAIELEGVYTRDHYTFGNDPVLGEHGAVRTYGGLGNVKFFIPYTPRFYGVTVTPFVAGGIGFGKAEYDGVAPAFAYRNSESGFMYQGKAGLELKTGDHVAVDVGYRYLESPIYDTPGSYSTAGYSGVVRSHIQGATIGLKYNF